MIQRVLRYLLQLKIQGRINAALARAAATAALRQVDRKDPRTWELSAFSQNGEDGILDYLTRHARGASRTFVEIGAADGLENNTTWLALGRKYSGLMIEGNAHRASRLVRTFEERWLGVRCRHLFVTRDSLAEVERDMCAPDPDVLSVDIDGNDFHIVEALLDRGLKPKILVVEYNAVFGPERAVTIPYQPDFDHTTAHPSQLYYGASIAAWRVLFGRFGYRFVTVEQNGVNAFAVDPSCFDSDFLGAIDGLPFRENFYHRMRFGISQEEQLALIAHLPLVDVKD